MLSGQLFGPGGQYHSRVIGSTGGQYGPLEGATAEKAVPFPCAARRSLDLRGRQQVAFVVALPHAAEPSPSRASLNGLDAINFFNAAMLAGFGPYVAVSLAEQKWTQENIGFVLTASGLAGLLALMPGGGVAGRCSSSGLGLCRSVHCCLPGPQIHCFLS